MRSDIDMLLKEEHIDALWVMGAMKNNADMVLFHRHSGSKER